MQRALLLNADYTPLKVLSWKEAMHLLFREKAYLVEQYVGKVVRTVSDSFPWPAVIALKVYTNVQNSVKFNRANVFARDRYRCVYCGYAPRKSSGSPALEELTFDHVVPRSRAQNGFVNFQGRRVYMTSWENIVTACCECNLKKGARTPEEAGMQIKRRPYKPSPMDAIRMHLLRYSIPEEWKQHLGDNSKIWQTYWEEELV